LRGLEEKGNSLGIGYKGCGSQNNFDFAVPLARMIQQFSREHNQTHADVNW
jgi:hypothetical protein